MCRSPDWALVPAITGLRAEYWWWWCYTYYIKNLHCSPLHTFWQLPNAVVILVYQLIVHWNSAVWYVGSWLHSLFLKTEILVMQWLFRLWEEFEIRRTHIRTVTRVRHCLPLVIGENGLYNLCDMRSCIVMEKAANFLFNTSEHGERMILVFHCYLFTCQMSVFLHNGSNNSCQCILCKCSQPARACFVFDTVHTLMEPFEPMWNLETI